MFKKKHQQNYIKQKNFYRKIICHKEYYADLSDLFNHIDKYIAETKEPFFKDLLGDTTTVALVTLGKYKLVIKRYNFRNFWHALKIRLRPSRAMRSWIFAHRLQRCAIPTAKPIAIVEERFGFLRGRAYYISEYIPGTRGCEYFKNGSCEKENWPKAILAIEELTMQLREQGFIHADYHFGNLIITAEQLFLIDLDSMQQYAKNTRKFQRSHEKDLRNFRRYLERNTEAKQAFQQFQQHRVF